MSPPSAGGPALERLDDEQRARLAELVELLVADHTAPSAVRSREEAWRVHVADALSGLGVPALARSARICDVGSGAGLPGLVLAVALPVARVDLLESVGRKCDFMRAAIGRIGIDRARVVCERAENWGAAPGGAAAYDAVTARAIGRLATIAELASPLLREGGVLVAWKGRRNPDEETELERAAERLAIRPVEVRAAAPYAGSRHRHLHVLVKTGPTPEGLPRRPGMAKKRPFGAA